MKENENGSDKYENYLRYLLSISRAGRFYKRYLTSPILFGWGRIFGPRIVEVGSGAGAGILGAFPSNVIGLEINPHAVAFTQGLGLRTSLIREDGRFPLPDQAYDACVLDNVLEHIEDPRQIMDECWRITQPRGGLVIAVPGSCGYARDADHKVFYETGNLRDLDPRWKLFASFSIPFAVSRYDASNASPR